MEQELQKTVLSPCNKICTIKMKTYYAGCFRTILEISHWATMTDKKRKRVMADLPRREAIHKAIQTNLEKR